MRCHHQWAYIEVVEMSRTRGNNFDLVTTRTVYQCITCEDFTYTEASSRETTNQEYIDVDIPKGSPSRWGT